MKKLQEKGVACTNYFAPIHLQPFYRKQFGYKPGDYPITEKIASSTIALPFFNTITYEQIDYVVEYTEKRYEDTLESAYRLLIELLLRFTCPRRGPGACIFSVACFFIVISTPSTTLRAGSGRDL